MKTLRNNKIERIYGFSFHLRAGYPVPTDNQLISAFNTYFNIQMSNYLSRRAIRVNYGSEVEMEYVWKKGYWKVKEVFFAQKRRAAR